MKFMATESSHAHSTGSRAHVSPTPRAASTRCILAILGGSAAAWVGLAFGIGVGLPWLVKAGFSGRTVLGIVALAIGVTALVTTGVLIVRSTRGWARLALLPWLVALGVGTFSLAIAFASTVVPPTPAPGTLASLPGAREVTMTTADGVTLSGAYVPGSNRAAVIIRHGAGSERSSTQEHAAVLSEEGYAVLLVDARGHGRSAGRAMDFGWNGESDTSAAVDFLATQRDVDPGRIAVLGLSMGGEEAIGAAGVDPRVRAVVAEGATGRTAADKTWLSEDYGLAGVVQEQWDRLTYGLVALVATAPQPASLQESVAATGAQVLVIAGGEVPDEVRVARRLKQANPRVVTI